jgi:hypothetical protein
MMRLDLSYWYYKLKLCYFRFVPIFWFDLRFFRKGPKDISPGIEITFARRRQWVLLPPFLLSPIVVVAFATGDGG